MQRVIRTVVWCCTAACLVTAAVEAQTVSEWKKVWNVELSVEPRSGMPKVFHLELGNRGEATLVGHNLLLNIYVDGSLYAWATDEKIRNEVLAIPVGQTVQRRLEVTSLVFADIRGHPITPAVALEHLAGGKWSVAATLTDLETPKPGFESSYLIWSNNLAIGESNDEH